MIKIGLTGSIACGKTFIESLFQEEGIITIDADKIVHQLLEQDAEVINKVENLFIQEFGSVKNDKGSISREKIGKIVFNNPILLKQMENILHPIVKEKIQDFFVENNDKDIAVAVIPLLFEAKMESLFDYILLVKATQELQVERLMKRNNLTKQQALNRIEIQMPQEEKAKKSDFIIDNNGSIEDTKLQFKKILNQIKMQ